MRISDYAMLSNCRTAALVSRSGSIDWFCWPCFDSAAVLCRILDEEAGGFLSTAPAQAETVERHYLPDTNVLATTFRTPRGTVRLTDALPITEVADAQGEGVRSHWLLRKIECLDGCEDVSVVFRPTFDYARRRARLQLSEAGAVARPEDGSLPGAALLCPGAARLDGVNGVVQFDLRLSAGEVRWVVLAMGDVADARTLRVPDAVLERALVQTIRWWRAWVSRLQYEGPYRGAVIRAALVLKGLTHEPTSGVVAAPTTSLPEEVGGVRNWDYRYAWLRDSSLIMHALLSLGVHEEAMAFWEWIQRLRRPGGRLQIAYRVDGSPSLDEETLAHLEGHRGSRPVRIGNAASRQQQSDVYGSVLDAAAECRRTMPEMDTPPFIAMIEALAQDAASAWRSADRGIWEVRGPPRHFVHSKVMCWVALDRAAQLARLRGDDQAARAWRTGAYEIHKAILTRGYDPGAGAFVQAFGEAALDASVLVIPLVGLLPPDDARVRSTLQRVMEELEVDGLVRRYVADDGLPGGEGAFLLCTHWLIDNLILQGRLDEAHQRFERVLALANDVGLLSEEVDPASGELLGNHPQGFSHLAIIRSAVLLARVADARMQAGPHPGHGAAHST